MRCSKKNPWVLSVFLPWVSCAFSADYFPSLSLINGTQTALSLVPWCIAHGALWNRPLIRIKSHLYDGISMGICDSWELWLSWFIFFSTGGSPRFFPHHYILQESWKTALIFILRLALLVTLLLFCWFCCGSRGFFKEWQMAKPHPPILMTNGFFLF